MYWIICVVFNVLKVDLWNTIVTACYGSPNTLSCVTREKDVNPIIMTVIWPALFLDILFINVSTVQYRVLASYHTIRKHPPCIDY
jgi:hypothetical protein